MTPPPQGAEGCRCWYWDRYDTPGVWSWETNPACPLHGSPVLPELAVKEAEMQAMADAITPEPHECETSRCWSECHPTPSVMLSPGTVACTRCDWNMRSWYEARLRGGDDAKSTMAWVVRELNRHMQEAHTTEKGSGGNGASILATGFRRLRAWIRGGPFYDD